MNQIETINEILRGLRGLVEVRPTDDPDPKRQLTDLLSQQRRILDRLPLEVAPDWAEEDEKDAPSAITEDLDRRIDRNRLETERLALLIPRKERKMLLLPEEDPSFWAEITGNTSLGGGQWTYSWKEKRKTATAYSWLDATNGKTGTDNAYNLLEVMNAGVGAGDTYGNGVPFDDLDTAAATFTIQPITTGNIVRLRRIRVASTLEYWFTSSNGVAGSCD